MNNVHQILSSMAKFDAEQKAREASFVGPRLTPVHRCRVGDVIDFRDRFSGNRYKGKVLAFGDGVHVGSWQMRVQVTWYNGERVLNSNPDRDVVNVLPEELLNIISLEAA